MDGWMDDGESCADLCWGGRGGRGMQAGRRSFCWTWPVPSPDALRGFRSSRVSSGLAESPRTRCCLVVRSSPAQKETMTLEATKAPILQAGPAWTAVKPFVLGGTAGSLATCCIQPIDMVKVRLQLQDTGAGRQSPFRIAQNILQNEGVRVFYTGLSAGIFRQVTYGTTRLGVFTTLEKSLGDENGHLSFGKRLLASIAAGGIGALVGTPADAALVRMQADTLLPAGDPNRRGYKHVGDALLRMAREEGARGFFVGASPTVYRGLAVNVGMLSTYATFKEWVEPVLGDGRVTHFVAGAMSGATAATASLPFDFIKTRLQRQVKGPDGKLPYNGFADCFMKTVRNDGVLGLYRGYVTYVFRLTPHITLTWVFLEALRNLDTFLTTPRE